MDDGTDAETPEICRVFGVKYIRLNRAHLGAYSNPSYPNNVGIRQSGGDVIILQNAECMHVDPFTVKNLAGRVTDTNVVFARVISLSPEGAKETVYCGKENPRPFFFCGAIKRIWFDRLRGFDEDYTGAGYDDDDFADRLRRSGVTFEFSDIEVHHQWHPTVLGRADFSPMEALFNQKKLTDVVRNTNRDWGKL